jgi:hypothetical protein
MVVMHISKIILFFILISALLTLSFECSSSEETLEKTETSEIKKEKSVEIEKYKELAKDKFGDNFSIQMNSDKTYVLCSNVPKSVKDNRPTAVSYFVYDLKNKKIVFEESIPDGNVSWLNEHQIIVTIIPGIVKGDDKEGGSKPGYIYDVIQMRKIFNPDQGLEEKLQLNLKDDH